MKAKQPNCLSKRLSQHIIGQPKKWDIYDNDTFQHPMAPYDVVMDPESLPKHPALQYSDDDSETNENKDVESESEVRRGFGLRAQQV